jgi:4-amino-4-deoxy-L-arabinose transferase-like glycosyltransferase
MKQHFAALSFIVLMSCLFGFTKLGSHHLQDWDESRQGINALEMIMRNDYINYTYDFKPDTWNAKPPLMIWTIVGMYKLLGYNAWALRVPSAIACVLFFVIAYQILRLFHSINFSLFVCLSLTGCKAIWWSHVGRTGDFDAFLLLFSTLFVYFCLLYFEKGKKNAVYFAAISLSLAFYSKGTACVFLLPGMFLYTLLFSRILPLFRDYRFYISILLFVIIVLSWLVLIKKYGFDYQEYGIKGARNAWETLFYYDTFNRFTNFQEQPNVDAWYQFILSALDVKLFLIGYAYYLSICLALYLAIANRNKFKKFFFQHKYRFIIISILLSSPLIIILTISSGKYDWYLAPVYLYISTIAAAGLFYLYSLFNWMKYLLIIIIAIQLITQYYLIYFPKQSSYFSLINDNNRFIQDGSLCLYAPKQSVFLECKWLNKNIRQVALDDLEHYNLLFSHEELHLKSLKLIKEYPEAGFLYKIIDFE